MTRAVVLALLIAACGKGKAKPAAEGPAEGPASPPVDSGSVAAPATPPETLRDQLRREIGKGGSVAILPAAEGLIALSADGKRRRTLVEGKITAALVDIRADVIWFGRETSSKMQTGLLDLRAASDAPPVIIADQGLAPIAYDAPKETLAHGLLVDEEDAVLDVASGAFLEGGKPCVEMCPKLVEGAAAKLAELAARAKGRSIFPPKPAAGGGVPAKVAWEDACPKCGTTTPLPGTPYVAVAVDAMGDFCHIVPHLYDPKTREFVALTDEGLIRSAVPRGELEVSIDEAWFCAGGDALVQGNTVRSFAGAVTWARGSSLGGGCLDGGWWFDAPDEPCVDGAEDGDEGGEGDGE